MLLNYKHVVFVINRKKKQRILVVREIMFIIFADIEKTFY